MNYNFPFPKLERRLVKKLNRMIERCTKKTPEKDAMLIIEGSEGSGKTNDSLVVAAYAKSLTNRNINLFFRLKNTIDFAKNTREQIIIWDEPGLDALSTDSLNKLNKNLIRLLMTCRYKRHFFIINMTKFSKFQEYIVVDRPNGFIHKDKNRVGHGLYIRAKNLEALWNDYKKYNKRNYRYHKSFYLDFPSIMTPELFNNLDITLNGKPHATLADYNRIKDESIAQIGELEADEKQDKLKNMIKYLKYKIGTLKIPVNTRVELINQLGIPVRTLENWKKVVINGDWASLQRSTTTINNYVGNGEVLSAETAGSEEEDVYE